MEANLLCFGPTRLLHLGSGETKVTGRHHRHQGENRYFSIQWHFRSPDWEPVRCGPDSAAGLSHDWEECVQEHMACIFNNCGGVGTVETVARDRHNNAEGAADKRGSAGGQRDHHRVDPASVQVEFAGAAERVGDYGVSDDGIPVAACRQHKGEVAETNPRQSHLCRYL